jgi:hypothetical protein
MDMAATSKFIYLACLGLVLSQCVCGCSSFQEKNHMGTSAVHIQPESAENKISAGTEKSSGSRTFAVFTGLLGAGLLIPGFNFIATNTSLGWLLGSAFLGTGGLAVYGSFKAF